VRELGRAADSAYEIPPEKKRKLLSQIHVIVERWRPFMAEIAPLFADFQRPASAAGPGEWQVMGISSMGGLSCMETRRSRLAFQRRMGTLRRGSCRP
jgi:hypothetical protein